MGVAYYRDYLKITELDNAARDIYMAAQNRAVLLHNEQRFSSLVTGGGTSGTYCISEATATEALDELLPLGTIDPTLRDHYFYIVYDSVTGSVTDVFYAEKALASTTPIAQALAMKTDRERRMKNAPMMGWYGGGKAGEIATKLLPASGVEVLITNSEELMVTVQIVMPESLPAGVAVNKDLKARLDYRGETVDLSASGDRYTQADGNTHVWVLDSLVNGKHFKDLKSGLSNLGGAFKITASVELSADGYMGSSYWAEDADNSLFAEETRDGDTAYIANLRHLQNLHPDVSGVGTEITKALQTADIECQEYKDNRGTVLDPAYSFTPINNSSMTGYDGREKEIKNLYVSFPGNAGLFGAVTHKGDTVIIRDVCLIAPDVNVLGQGNVGSLVGRIGIQNGDGPWVCEFINCSAINASETANKTETGNDWGAGGLVGRTGHTTTLTMDRCRVYWDNPGQLVSGPDIQYTVTGCNAGGLLGLTGNAGRTDCKLQIKQSFAATTVYALISNAGGLIGHAVNTDEVTIQNSYADCYAAGFITGSSTTAGLVGGTATASNSCSAVRVIDADGTPKDPQAKLYSGLTSDDPTKNVYYLTNPSTVTEELSGFLSERFERKTTEGSHPYNLRPGVTLETYPYPGLKGMDHYNDWAAQFSPPKLVYYEQYEDGYAISDGNLSVLRDQPVRKDGMVTGELENQDKFYQKLHIELTLTEGTAGDVVTADYLYNPHFAAALAAYHGDSAGGTIPRTVRVRTPRHLYDLSRFFDRYGAIPAVTFRQELDYSAYRWYREQNGMSGDCARDPIGTSASPFLGSYEGGCKNPPCALQRAWLRLCRAVRRHAGRDAAEHRVYHAGHGCVLDPEQRAPCGRSGGRKRRR